MPDTMDKLRYAMEDEAWGHYLYADNTLSLASIAVSMKRIADALDSRDEGGRMQGTVLYWLEIIAGAANAGRS